MSNTSQPYRDRRPIADHSHQGGGNAQDPTFVTFRVSGAPYHNPDALRSILPATVRLMDIPGGHKLIGVDPNMSRTALYDIFIRLCDRMGWQPRHHE